MASLRVLVVADGVTDPYETDADDAMVLYFAGHGISFRTRITDPAVMVPGADDQFTLKTFLDALSNSTTYLPGSPQIQVDTAHRHSDSANMNNFNFVTSVPDLSVYDVIWLFGYEGLDGSNTVYLNFAPITLEERN
jgi:hypothetical protein